VKKPARKIKQRAPRCTCRAPKRHRDCSYCGVTAHMPDYVCGVCKEAGIDGKTIPGTARRTCAMHKKG
jgi:hypothetical protein